jgi:putative hemolysin
MRIAQHGGMHQTTLHALAPHEVPVRRDRPFAPLHRVSAMSPAFETCWARHADEVRAAQRLRWRVFVDEMGAQLRPPPGAGPGVDADRFDPHCEHLLVRTLATANAPAQVVGTYRVLTPAAARMLGGLYTETEFNLTPLAALRPRMVELGRSCVDPAYRHGTVIMMLWSSLVDFMRRGRLDTAIGCASVAMHDSGHGAASLWRSLASRHLAAPALQVRPRLPLPLADLRQDLDPSPPQRR